MKENLIPTLQFKRRDLEKLKEQWADHVAIGAIAATCSLDLQTVLTASKKPKGSFSTQDIKNTLKNLGLHHKNDKGFKVKKPTAGINRVQWEGDWLKPKVIKKEGFKHIHYIAYKNGFVYCAYVDPEKWITFEEWKKTLVLKSKPYHINYNIKLVDSQKLQNLK